MRREGVPAELWRTLTRRERWKTALYVVLSLGSALAGGLATLLFVPLVQPEHAWPVAGRVFDLHGVDAQALAFAAATAAFAAARWQASCVGARLVAGYGVALRRHVHGRLVEAPLRELAGSASAEIANVLTYNVEIAIQAFSAFQQLLVAALTATVSLGFAFVVSPPLMLVAPLLAVFAWLASRLFGREQVEVGRRYVADMTSLFWHSEDFPRRLRHVRSFGREAAEKASYGRTSSRLGEGYARQLELIASGRLLLELVAATGIAAMFMLARRWPGIDPASLVAVCLLLGRLLPYLVSTRQSFQQLRSAAPAFALWRRYADLEAAPRERAADSAWGRLRIERLRVTPPAGGVELGGMVLVPGELTLLSGDSGIGKSSLVDALAGMIPPEVFVASRDGQSLDFDGYRAAVGRGAYVGQNVRPWQHDVAACLRWAAPDATDAALLAALDDVGLAKPLDAPLHDVGGRLSGGELQRLLLAQVILRRPALALLDEATSALDAAAELAVLGALKRRLPDTALVVVSHRPGVAALAEQVVTIAGDRTTSVTRTGQVVAIRTIVPSRDSA
ncbi:MAG: ABC transporter ATP-binding protein [Luteibacter sp.]